MNMKIFLLGSVDIFQARVTEGSEIFLELTVQIKSYLMNGEQNVVYDIRVPASKWSLGQLSTPFQA